MRFTALFCLFAMLATVTAAFPIKTRHEQGHATAHVEKTTLYDMIFGGSNVQKPTNKASGHPVHDGIRVHWHRKPARNTVHLHPRKHVQGETK